MNNFSYTATVTGDALCGKSYFLCSNASLENRFQDIDKEVNVDGIQVKLSVKYTYAIEDWDTRRKFYYNLSSVVLVFYAINNPVSLMNIKEVWLPEVKSSNLDVPIVVVGLKKDLRDDADAIAQLTKENIVLITPEEGRKMAEAINAFAHVECSAKTGEGVDEVYNTAVRAIIAKEQAMKQEKPPMNVKNFLKLFKRSK